MNSKLKSLAAPGRSHSGFTLIELMIVVAVVGILAAIAYPSYAESVAKGKRARATTQLLAAQQWMERWYTENYSYAANTVGVSVNDASQFPARFGTVPADGGSSSYYAITLDNLSANTYTLVATPSGSMANDKCGVLSLTQVGQKKVPNFTTNFPDEPAAVAYCWR